MEQIVNFIANFLEVSSDDVKADTLIRDLVGDSLDLIELMLQIEDQYGIEIPDEEFDRLITVQDIHEYVTSLEYESGSI